jgi:hypothetical protein
MTDNLEQLEAGLTPEQRPQKPPTSSLPGPDSNTVSQTPQKSKRTLWIIVGVAIFSLCCISSICVSIAGVGGIAGLVNHFVPAIEQVGSVIDSYMKSMMAKDVEGAYAFLSPSGQRDMPISEFHKLIEGNNYFMFKGYQSMSLGEFTLSYVSEPDPEAFQGEVVFVDGTISYDDGFEGTFEGYLEKVEGEWKIGYINIDVPLDKVQP